MTGQEIINKFSLWVDDGTELSATDELELLNDVYKEVWTERPWEFAKKSYSGSISGTTVALPSDLAYITENARYTDNQANNYIDNQAPRLVWIGDNYYRLINWSDRKQYEGKEGYCYIDIVNDNLVFTTSVSGTVEYDYVFFPEDLTTSTSPVFPSAYHKVLVHLMASSDYAIQQFNKAKSYASENQVKANEILEKMRIWNANLFVN